MANAHRATVDFTLSWTSFCAKHSDVQRVQIVDFWRDIFPANFCIRCQSGFFSVPEGAGSGCDRKAASKGEDEY